MLMNPMQLLSSKLSAACCSVIPIAAYLSRASHSGGREAFGSVYY